MWGCHDFANAKMVFCSILYSMVLMETSGRRIRAHNLDFPASGRYQNLQEFSHGTWRANLDHVSRKIICLSFQVSFQKGMFFRFGLS